MSARNPGQIKDPGREIALIALSSSGFQPGAMLEDVLRAAFDQLCWHRTTPELLALVDELRAVVTESEGA